MIYDLEFGFNVRTTWYCKFNNPYRLLVNTYEDFFVEHANKIVIGNKV